MSDSVRPHRRQPTRLPRPWDSPGKNTGVGCHFLLQYMKVKVKLLSRVQPSATPWTTAFQAPPSMGFSRQEYRSGMPLPSPGKQYPSGFFHRDEGQAGVCFRGVHTHLSFLIFWSMPKLSKSLDHMRAAEAGATHFEREKTLESVPFIPQAPQITK